MSVGNGLLHAFLSGQNRITNKHCPHIGIKNGVGIHASYEPPGEKGVRIRAIYEALVKGRGYTRH